MFTICFLSDSQSVNSLSGRLRFFELSDINNRVMLRRQSLFFYIVLIFLSSCLSYHVSLRSVRKGASLRKLDVWPRQKTLLSTVEDTTVIQIDGQQSPLKKIESSLKLVYKFCRPHTIKGTMLASFMGVTRALLENPNKFNTALVPRAVIGLFALLCGNAYIVGINQIYDVKIDEVRQ